MNYTKEEILASIEGSLQGVKEVLTWTQVQAKEEYRLKAEGKKEVLEDLLKQFKPQSDELKR